MGTDNTALVSVRVLENDVALTKTVDNPTPPLGGLVTYTIRATNHGPDTAEVLDVYDVVTQGSRAFVSATATRGIVTPEAPPPAFLPGATAPARLWTLGTLPVGATETLTLVERVTSLGPLANTAATDAGLHVDPSLANNVASATVEVQPVADIAVTKRVSPATTQVGETVTFTVTATNRGPNDATGVQISDGLPAGLTLLAATPSQGAYDPATGAWAVGALATGAAATLDLAARVDQAGELTNVATRTAADQFDPDPSNNAGGATLTSLPSADIQVRKTVTNPVPNVNDDVTFTLTVTNAGPTAASGVQVTDRLPGGLTLVSATPSQGTYTIDTGIWDIGALPDGGRVTLDLVATVTQAGVLHNLATKTAQGEDDPVSLNNAAGVILNGQEADIQVRKTVDRTVPVVGEIVTYTVTVTNHGPSAATGVQVTDRLPAGLTFVDATPSQGTYHPGTGVWDSGRAGQGRGRRHSLLDAGGAGRDDRHAGEYRDAHPGRAAGSQPGQRPRPCHHPRSGGRRSHDYQDRSRRAGGARGPGALHPGGHQSGPQCRDRRPGGGPGAPRDHRDDLDLYRLAGITVPRGRNRGD